MHTPCKRLLINKERIDNKGLKVLSLCGGIETGLLALQELGIPVAEYHTYEILPEAIAVSQHHFPWIMHHGDLIGEDFTKYKGFDLILVGFCCQSLSRVRIEDKNVNSGLKGKSGIFYETIRAMEEIQPKWFLFENVIPSSEEDLFEMNKKVGVDAQLINSNKFLEGTIISISSFIFLSISIIFLANLYESVAVHCNLLFLIFILIPVNTGLAS